MGRKRLVWCVLIVSSATLISAAPPIPGDLNKDNAVNYKDLDVLSDYWLLEDCISPDCEGDLDGVSGVNMLDFAVLGQQWGKSNLVINEFMASNNTFEDPEEEGEYPDWIEIFNPGSEPCDLGGMYITDDFGDLDKWQIPEGVIIAPNDFLVFWADDDDEQGDFHTNFKLSQEGEEIALVDIDGSSILDSITYENQEVDSSEGRYPDGSQNWYPLILSTPNIPNVAGISGEPRFSRPSGAFVEPFELEIIPSTTDSNSQVYYKSDRSIREFAYTEPILIDDTGSVSANVRGPDKARSPFKQETYIAIDPALANFHSTLPIVLIDSWGYDIDSEWEPDDIRPFRDIVAVFIDTNDVGRATITDYPDYAGNAAMHVRGNSSADYEKKQYRVEIRGNNNRDKDVSLLGMPADSDWILFGPYSDKTLMRNEIMYSWNRDMERYGVRCRFVEAFINMDMDRIIDWNSGAYGTGTDYRGVYILMEKIKRGQDRIDIAKIGPGDSSEPDVTGGYIFKKDWFWNLPYEARFKTSEYKDDLIYEYPEWDEISTAQKNWINNWFTDYETALSGPDFDDPVDGYAPYIDILSFIDHQILVEIARNVDGYVLSTYLYKDRLGKLNMGPIWDYNGALGGADYFESYLIDGWHFENPEFPADNPNGYHWYDRLWQDPEFLLKWADRWFEMRRGKFATDKMMAEIDENAALLTDNNASDNPVNRNFERWQLYVNDEGYEEDPPYGSWQSILNAYIWPNFYHGSPLDPHTYQMEIDHMKNWLTGRLDWMDLAVITQMGSEPPIFSQQGGQVQEGYNLTMDWPASSPSAETLIYAGSQWRYLDEGSDEGTWWRTGNVSSWDEGYAQLGYGDGDEATVVSYGSDPDNKYVTTYFRQTFYIDNVSDIISLTLGLLRDDGAVVYINGDEVVRTNMPGGTIEYDTLADVITGGGEESTFNEFSIDPSVLEEGENIFAVEIHQGAYDSSDISFDLWLDADVAGGGGGSGDIYYTTNGDDPRLWGGGISGSASSYSSGVTLNQSAEIKARIKDGSSWSAINTATFAVGPVADNLRISEIMYHPEDTGNPHDPNTEFIELTNAGAESINLNLVKFTDGIEFTFPPIQLTQDERVVVVKDTSAFEDKYGTGINIAGEYSGRLDNGGEEIELEDANEAAILEFDYEDDWFPMTDGRGYSLTIIDPYESNLESWDRKTNWRISVSADGSPGSDDSSSVSYLPGDLLTNEVLAHSHGGAPDWIELHNTTGSSIDISGWYLSDDANEFTKYQIQSETIPSDGFIVFYEDQTFGNPGNPGTNDDFGLSENGEEISLISLADSFQQFQKFGASNTGVSFGRHTTSTGKMHFVRMSSNTAGFANSSAKVGPVVITEIMYHPENDKNAEYVELQNITDSKVNLFDIEGVPWKFTDGGAINFLFPADANIPANGTILLVKDSFDFEYENYPAVPNEIQTFNWLEGNLSNAGEQITIANPGDLEDGERQYITIDTVEYDDELPWPTAPDGTGKVLQKIDPNLYGNDPANWQSNDPSPGAQGWTVLTYDDFEGGWGNWNDGGTDCYLYTGGTYAHQGSNAIGLQDNSSTSFMTTDNLELSSYSQVKVEFWYYPQSFDSTDEDFWLQISTDGGSNFSTVEEWNRDDEFLNDNFYSDSVIISGYTLTSNTKLRFRCDASGDADDVYIDEVKVWAQ